MSYVIFDLLTTKSGAIACREVAGETFHPITRHSGNRLPESLLDLRDDQRSDFFKRGETVGGKFGGKGRDILIPTSVSVNNNPFGSFL